ncbi:hypothetical protein [Streptomyces sp. NPDC051636]|uniref:hypothetical protein n=1 Tax=Streptomyces sp. NPDC051636 TaxID=3365663 RepID=UPI0037B2ED3B
MRRTPPQRLALALAGCVAGTFLIAAVTPVLPSTPHTDVMPISTIQIGFGYNFPLPCSSSPRACS